VTLTPERRAELRALAVEGSNIIRPDEIIELLDATEWRPIESAPDRGVILTHSHQGFRIASSESSWGWITVSGRWTTYPTHWMPLPTPPEDAP
jgi:hypothetical protein